MSIMSTHEMVKWLARQLDFDERWAQAVPGNRRVWETGGGFPETGSTQVADPIGVLADITAKRRLIAMYMEAKGPCSTQKGTRMWDPAHASHAGRLVAMGTVMQVLAGAYADRDGWREAWGLK